MRKYFLIILLSIFSLPLWAENVTNIRVRQEGKNIVITYDLKQKSIVRIGMATGNSTEFKELKAVSGDVGKGVSAGTNKQIVFRPLDESEKFIAQNVRFKVVAQSSFDVYARNHLPHAKIIAPESEREFGVSVLEEIYNVPVRNKSVSEGK